MVLQVPRHNIQLGLRDNLQEIPLFDGENPRLPLSRDTVIIAFRDFGFLADPHSVELDVEISHDDSPHGQLPAFDDHIQDFCSDFEPRGFSMLQAPFSHAKKTPPFNFAG